ncbi:hypothetical protein CR492_03555 [Methylocella silvestris]|uniref:Uncharacterized protein n=1 Tax=Methylocella silvestris TaxID=199596 RepID=A0A2J7TKU2_METSI|nr:hypothetical protein CR492_03555 [Methylocella silvestris]
MHAPQEANASPALKTLGDVIVNVRFFPDGAVNTIDNRPVDMSAQAWFHLLCRMAPNYFQALAGGRGHYRIPFERFQAILDQTAKAS